MADNLEHELSADDYATATANGRDFERGHPKAIAARYDAPSGRLVVDFENGSTFLVPVRSLQDLSEASDADLSAVTLHHDYFLRWPDLGVNFTVPGLLAGTFGTAAFMETARTVGPARPTGTRESGKGEDRPRRIALREM
jgi:hypothetical protein